MGTNGREIQIGSLEFSRTNESAPNAAGAARDTGKMLDFVIPFAQPGGAIG
jgi:hypothetical protein